MFQAILTILKQVKRYWLPSVLTPLCIAGEVIMELSIPYVMASLIDEGILGGSMEAVYRYGGLMILLACFSLLFGVLGGIFSARAATGVAYNLRDSMYENIQTYSFSNIDKYSTAGLVTRLTTDVTNLQNAYQMILRMCTRAPMSLVVSMVMAFTISPKISKIFLIAVVVLAIGLVLIMSTTISSFQKIFRKYDDLNMSVQENVSAIRVVKAFVRGDYETERFQSASNHIYKLFTKAEKILALNGPLMMCIVYGCVIMVSFMGSKLIVGGSMTTGDLSSLLSYIMSIMMSLMMLSMIFVMITMSIASIRRIAEVINEKSDLVNGEDPVYDVADGSVDFNAVSFSYKQGNGKAVLQDIDVHIKSGETIGIIGGTGSSKSSFVNLISRLYDVTEGSVCVGGLDVRRYDIETLRNEVSVVLQMNTLFSGTILENLRWGDANAGEEECIRACKLACADEFIEKMPDKYNTYIEQGGTNVSGGQKQRLCIARALLKKPKILILDDSTSAVDTATDARIRKAFREEIPETTKFIIAQRVSSIMDADRILVLDGGRINGFGTHEQLLENNEIYREVYISQTQGGGDFDEGGEG